MARRLPSLNALRAFEAAGRLGRMTLAADELHVSHGAVSRQVRQLEGALGVPLFEGPKNRLRLTEAGGVLRHALTQAFDQIDGAVRLVSDAEDGPLDVSCPGTLSMRWLIPRLHRFQAGHPGIEVRLTASSHPVDAAREGADVAIRVGRPPWPAEAAVVPLFAEHTGLVHAAGLPMDPGGPPPAWLHTRTRPEAWEDWLARSAVRLEPGRRLVFEHVYFMLEAACAGLGLCVAPWHYVAGDIRAGRLLAPFGFTASGRSTVALRRPSASRKALRFCDWLRQEAAEFEAAGFEGTPSPRDAAGAGA